MDGSIRVIDKYYYCIFERYLGLRTAKPVFKLCIIMKRLCRVVISYALF